MVCHFHHSLILRWVENLHLFLWNTVTFWGSSFPCHLYKVLKKYSRVSVVHIYSLLSHIVCTFKKCSSKSVKVFVMWILGSGSTAPQQVGTKWVSFSHVLSDEATVHIYGVVNCHNCRILGQWECPNGEWLLQLQGQCMVQYHIGPNCWTLYLPQEQHHKCGYLDMLENFMFPHM
jgi:hypothetical protein